MSAFLAPPPTKCEQLTPKVSQIGQETSEISSKPSLMSSKFCSKSVLMISHSILDQFARFLVLIVAPERGDVRVHYNQSKPIETGPFEPVFCGFGPVFFVLPY